MGEGEKQDGLVDFGVGETHPTGVTWLRVYDYSARANRPQFRVAPAELLGLWLRGLTRFGYVLLILL